MREVTDNKLKATTSKASRVTPLGLNRPATRSVLVELAEPLVAVPPDGGWGWLVVAVSFTVMFCIDGVGYCFALFFEEISADFKCSITEVTIVASVSGGCYYLIGPLTCSAVNRFGFQIIAVTGGILAGLIYLGASFMTSLPPFLALIGFVGGTAFNLMYTPSVIAIGFYFERWRALAMAICCCGSSLGVMCFPLIMEECFGNFGWRTKFRIIAIVFGACGILGLIYKPIKATKFERTVQFGDVSQMASMYTINNETELKHGLGIAAVFQRFKNALFPTISEVSVLPDDRSTRHGSKTSSTAYSYYMHRPDDEDMTSTYMRPDSQGSMADFSAIIHPLNVKGSAMDNKRKRCIKRCRSCMISCCSHCHGSHCCMKTHELSLTNINRPLYRDDIFYGGSVYGLPQYSTVSVPISRGIPSLAYTLSVSRAPTQRDLEQQTQCVICPEAFLRVLTTMLHFQMLKSPAFLILLFSGYLSLAGTYIIVTYIGQCARQRHLDSHFATLLLSIFGVSNTFGRAACGVISCFPALDMNVVSWITIGISGISFLFTAFATTKMHFIIVCSIGGFNLASFAVLRALVFVELFGLENLTNCFGLNMIFQSLAAFTGNPVANFIFSKTHSFVEVFMFTGVAIFVSGIVLIPIKCIIRWELKRKKKVTFN